MKAKWWHHFVHQTAVKQGCETTFCAGDGGSVCIVSTDRDEEEFHLVIVVFNPLTTE